MKGSARIVLLLVLICLLGKFNVRAQAVFSLPVSGNYKEITFLEMLLDLEKRYPVKFYYEPTVLPYYQINYTFTDITLYEALQKVLPQNGLTCTAARENGIIICRKSDLYADYLRALLKRWDEGTVELPDFLSPSVLDFSVGTAPAATANQVLSGKIIDAKSREGIVGVTIAGKTPGTGAVTDAEGRFRITLQPGAYVFEVNYLGYRSTTLNVQLLQSGEILVPLEIRALELAGVEIQGNRLADRQKSVATGVEMLSTRTIKEIPAFMGEADVVKSLLALPGVSTVGEGASGFNVRGGNVDQNLVIQDDIPFFNTSHVLGFFSVFNPDLVRSTTLYKGHVPARFGGRSAAALEVRQREGDFTRWQGLAGVGFASAKAAVEGPIVKEKLSVLIGARASYSDWMLKQAKLPEVKGSSAWFNDVNAKLSYRPGANTLINAGFHRSEDYFRYADAFGYGWQTMGGNLSWRQSWSEKFSTNFSAATGRLKNNYFIPAGTDAFDLYNGLQFSTLNIVSNLHLWKNHEIQFGGQLNSNAPLDQDLRSRDGSGIAPKSVSLERGTEIAVFAEDEWKINNKISLSAGLRQVFFQTRGPHTRFRYESGKPYDVLNIVDTLFYANNAVSARYGGLEPRLSFNFRLNDQHAFKLSYNRLRQFVHLISNTVAPTPADIWQVSNTYLPPQRSDNFGAGWFFTPESSRWEYSVEGFYRKTADVPVFKDFAELFLNDHLETEIIVGQQRSYGGEFLVRKNKGRLSGWASYTFSRVFQQAVTEFEDFTVNNGNWFPANFDQPHQVILFSKMEVNPAFFFTANFTYRTGRPVAAPQSAYQVGNVLVPNFSERNQLRIPDYHRLDVGMTIDKTRSRISGLKWTLNVSIYNVYARENPFSVFFRRDRNGLNKAYQLSVIGAAIPAANVTFFF